MKVFWTLAKIALGLVLVIPVGLLMLGVIGTAVGLAVMLLRFAILGLLAYGAVRLLVRLMRGPSAPRVETRPTPALGSADPYYQAAMRELDRDIA